MCQRRILLSVTLFLLGCMGDAFADGEYSPTLKKAVATYDKVMGKAKADLIDGFDSAAKSIAKRKANALEKTHLLEVVEAEKSRFIKSGEPPWSEPMRVEFQKYVKSTSQARIVLQRVVEAEVNKLLKSGESESAKQLSTAFEASVSPQAVGRWVHSAAGYPDVTITMYSNGKFTDRDGKPNCEWAYENGTIFMKWPSSFGGYANVKVQVSDDGLTYRNGPNDGVLNTGRYVSLTPEAPKETP